MCILQSYYSILVCVTKCLLLVAIIVTKLDQSERRRRAGVG